MEDSYDNIASSKVSGKEANPEDEGVMIATTRPELMSACVAVVVHPDDERYKKYVGMKAINPANGDELPIMADSYIDLDFGTAVMKCTPAHDPNDFALAKKYNLPMPICMNPDGTMNDMCGKYAGMDRFECREALVNDFKEAGVVDHIEEHLHQVGHSERTLKTGVFHVSYGGDTEFQHGQTKKQVKSMWEWKIQKTLKIGHKTKTY